MLLWVPSILIIQEDQTISHTKEKLIKDFNSFVWFSDLYVWSVVPEDIRKHIRYILKISFSVSLIST